MATKKRGITAEAKPSEFVTIPADMGKALRNTQVSQGSVTTPAESASRLGICHGRRRKGSINSGFGTRLRGGG